MIQLKRGTSADCSMEGIDAIGNCNENDYLIDY